MITDVIKKDDPEIYDFDIKDPGKKVIDSIREEISGELKPFDIGLRWIVGYHGSV